MENKNIEQAPIMVQVDEKCPKIYSLGQMTASTNDESAISSMGMSTQPSQQKVMEKIDALDMFNQAKASLNTKKC